MKKAYQETFQIARTYKKVVYIPKSALNEQEGEEQAMSIDHNPQQGIGLIGHKWTLLIICALSGGKRRYSELQRDIEGVSQKMLTQTLRGLEQNGIVARKVYPVVPPKVEYYLTPLGETLRAPVKAIRLWVTGHQNEMESASAAYLGDAASTDEPLEERV